MTVIKHQLDRLKGKVAWITGGKRVGQVVAQALADQGVSIVASYRSSQKEADLIVSNAKKSGVDAIAVKMDATNKEEVKKAVTDVSKKFPKIDILINMSSIFRPVKADKIQESDWNENISAHILGTFWPVQTIVPLMPNGSHIINIADRTSIGTVYKGYTTYVVTKEAVASLTRTLAVEYAEKGIFVNAIAPGPILRPEDISQKDWDSIRNSSLLKVQVSDQEAVEQFSLLVTYLSLTTVTSGHIYPLDLGKNL